MILREARKEFNRTLRPNMFKTVKKEVGNQGNHGLLNEARSKKTYGTGEL